MSRSHIPTQLKILRGNPGKHKLNLDEPVVILPPEPPEPPTELTGLARAEWERIVAELFRWRVFTWVDVHPLVAYCREYELAEIAWQKWVAAGRPIITDDGLRHHPLARAITEHGKAMLKHASEFGFTPAARSRISTVKAQKPAGKFEGLVAGSADSARQRAG
jgi:P27 family predicted phage terminase small subunit